MDRALEIENNPSWLPKWLKPLWNCRWLISLMMMVTVLAVALRYLIEVGRTVEFDFSGKIDGSNKIVEFSCHGKPPQ